MKEIIEKIAALEESMGAEIDKAQAQADEITANARAEAEALYAAGIDKARKEAAAVIENARTQADLEKSKLIQEARETYNPENFFKDTKTRDALVDKIVTLLM